jgi:alpha-tubulin suppressor-like RCC1 family protein
MRRGRHSSFLIATLAAAAVSCGESSPSDPGPDPDPDPTVRPRLTIVAPDDGAAFAALGVELRFRIDDAPATGYRVTVDDAIVSDVEEAIAAGSEETIALTLADGIHVIDIELLDGEGVADREDLVIVIDLPPGPEIVFDGPATGTLFEDSTTVSGRVNSERAVNAFVLMLGDTELPDVVLTAVDGGYAFSAAVPLAVGDNLVIAKAMDDLDRSTEVSRTVVRALDQAAPRIAVAWPRNGHGVRTRALVVRGTVADERAVTSAVIELGDPGEPGQPGQPAQQSVPVLIDDSGSFQAAITLAPGTNRYRIRVIDASGNEAILEREVYFGQRIGAGGAHSGFLLDGSLYAWGRNQKGQVGLGYTSVLGDTAPPHPTSATPVPAPGATFVSLAFAQNASIALDASGHVWGWGDNANGQLCLGITGNDENDDGVDDFDSVDRHVPVQAPEIDQVVAVARGFNHTLLLRADGTVWACGRNASGQLGDGTTTGRDVPVQVQGLAGIVQISAGSESSYAVDAAGALWAWGRNSFGNLGQGTDDTAPHPAPSLVPGLEGVAMIANGRDHVLALLHDGTVRAWGLNASNQVGADGIGGFTDDVLSPVEVPGIAGAVSVHANGNQGFYEDAEGQLWGWGQNGNTGNLGIPQEGDRPAPSVPVFGLAAVVDVAIGPLHGVVLDAAGTLFAWGWSFEGSLGGGDSTIDAWGYRIPILVELAE